MTTILVVEDESLLCNDIVGELQEAGFKATGAANGVEALKILEQVLNDPAIQHHLDIKAEAIVFAAELNHEIGNHDTVRKYLGQFNDIDLSQIEPDLIEHAVFTASQLKERIDSLSS